MKTLKNVGKRVVALVLALMMCVGMLATTAFAEDVPEVNEPEESTQAEVKETETPEVKEPETTEDEVTIEDVQAPLAAKTLANDKCDHDWVFDHCAYTVQPVCSVAHSDVFKCSKCPATKTVHGRLHDHTYEWTNALDAGNWDTFHGQKCTRCGWETNIGLHDWQDATCVAPATCPTCGATKGKNNPNNHTSLTWNHDETSHWQECTACNKSGRVNEDSHTIVNGVCDVCGYTETPVTPTEPPVTPTEPVTPSECQHTDKIYTAVDSDHASHTWSCAADGCGATGTVSGNVLSWTGTDVSTLCPGQTTTHTAQCAVCRSLVSKQVSGTGSHSFTNYVSNNDATCTKDGTETAKCDHCDATDTRTEVGSATGHDFNHTKFTALDGEHHVLYCANGCGTYDPDFVMEHNYKTEVVGGGVPLAPTCQHQGYKAYQCTCGLIEFEVLDRIDHIYENGVCKMCGKVDDNHECVYSVPGDVIKDPTCNEEGMQFFSCEICHDTIIKSLAVDPDAHAYHQAVEVFPTCVDDGYETLICVHCGEIQENMPTGKPATGIHTPGEAVEENRVPARVGVAGSYDTVVYCDVCGNELSRENHTIPALPDTGTGDVVIDDTNPPLGGDPDGGEVELDDIDVPLAGPVTRGEFVDYLYRREGAPDTALSTFVDVPADHDYANAVGWGQANNIAWGISETEFAPDELVTVEQVKLFLSRYAAFKGNEMPELAALVGLDDQDYAMNCDEILGEFFGADE